MGKIISTTKANETNVQLAARPDHPERLGGQVSLMALNDKKRRTHMRVKREVLYIGNESHEIQILASNEVKDDKDVLLCILNFIEQLHPGMLDKYIKLESNIYKSSGEEEEE
jgi:hypothetical protein